MTDFINVFRVAASGIRVVPSRCAVDDEERQREKLAGGGVGGGGSEGDAQFVAVREND